MTDKRYILSPMGTGNGAYIIHKTIESCIADYHVAAFNPYRALFPLSLFFVGRFSQASLIHTTPEYAFFHKRRNIPLILTFHNYVLDRFMEEYSTPLQRIHYQNDLKFFTKLSVGKADIITTVSRFTANLVQQELNLPDHIRIIYNGVDHTLFTPKKRNGHKWTKKINVLFCGNLTLRKGVQWLGPIADRLNRNINILYTSGLQPGKDLANHPQLHCLGTVPHSKMPSVYQDADILLFPTVREGFGLAAAEAMSCGLPVVATDCSSLPELIDHGKGGFLCPLGDVDAFAEKILVLADNPELRLEMGDYNRAKVEKMFTLDRMIGQYKQLFEEVLLNSPSG